jgi:hypothetical protein
MPFLTSNRKASEVKAEEVYYPEIKWEIEDHDGKYEGNEKGILTIMIEQAPRNRTIKYREMFYSGGHENYYLQIPWEYYIARVSSKGVILLSAMFFANREITGIDKKGICCAPLPNNDYGKDKGLGVCLWKAGASFGSDPRKAAMKAHEYIWTSAFNPGVSYYEAGRPDEIHSSKGWPGSLEKWQSLTKEAKKITWIPVYSKKLQKDCETLEDAFLWLSKTTDHIYQ